MVLSPLLRFCWPPVGSVDYATAHHPASPLPHLPTHREARLSSVAVTDEDIAVFRAEFDVGRDDARLALQRAGGSLPEAIKATIAHGGQVPALSLDE